MSIHQGLAAVAPALANNNWAAEEIIKSWKKYWEASATKFQIQPPEASLFSAIQRLIQLQPPKQAAFYILSCWNTQ